MDYTDIIHRTADNSYFITKNGLPYHVPNEGRWAEEWAEVHAYVQQHPECVTEEQPCTPSTSDFAGWIRKERDNRLAACTWIIERHRDQTAVEEGTAPTLTGEAYQAWLGYRQALRDITAVAGFPWTGPASAPWPEAPLWR